jgi:pimeloyl-ACP methyl ester carboxylesterase
MSSSETYVPRVARRSTEHAIRGVDYRVSEWGDAGRPLLVLLHGWGDAGASFQFLVDALADAWFVIAPDWRGFGESANRSQSYWFPDYLADLHALLDVYSPDEAVRLVGHSMGANVAGLYAGVFPERVAAFVNIEGFGLAESDPGKAPAHYRRWIEKSRAAEGYATYTAFDELAARILKRSPRMSRDRALYVAGVWARRQADGTIELRADPAHRLPNAVQYRRAEAMACWAGITAPMLVIAGGESSFFNGGADSNGPTAIDGFAAAATVVIPEAGHMVHFEQPARLAAALEQFLATDLR